MSKPPSYWNKARRYLSSKDRVMKTLIKTHAKQNIQSIESFTDLVEVKSINAKTRSGFKFYQTLFIMVFTLCTFLIFP